VDLYIFVSWCIVTIAAVTLLWPLNILLVALAYRVRRGTQPAPVVEGLGLWWRFVLASSCLAVLTLVVLGLMFLLVHGASFPFGPIHATLLAAYLPAAIALLYWSLALEDLLEALGVFLLYILLPGLPLLLIGRLTGFWTNLGQAAPWLLPTL
jgi:hypothetical protein